MIDRKHSRTRYHKDVTRTCIPSFFEISSVFLQTDRQTLTDVLYIQTRSTRIIYDYLAEMRDSSVTNILFASWQSVQFVFIRCKSDVVLGSNKIFTIYIYLLQYRVIIVSVHNLASAILLCTEAYLTCLSLNIHLLSYVCMITTVEFWVRSSIWMMFGCCQCV